MILDLVFNLIINPINLNLNQLIDDKKSYLNDLF